MSLDGHFEELAQAFIELDLVFRDRLDERATLLSKATGFSHDVCHGLIEQGAILYKKHEIIQRYEEAKRAADGDTEETTQEES